MGSTRRQIEACLKQGLSPETVGRLFKVEEGLVRAVELNMTKPNPGPAGPANGDFSPAEKSRARQRIVELSEQDEVLGVAFRAAAYVDQAGRSDGFTFTQINDLLKRAKEAAQQHEQNNLIIEIPGPAPAHAIDAHSEVGDSEDFGTGGD